MFVFEFGSWFLSKVTVGREGACIALPLALSLGCGQSDRDSSNDGDTTATSAGTGGEAASSVTGSGGGANTTDSASGTGGASTTGDSSSMSGGSSTGTSSTSSTGTIDPPKDDRPDRPEWDPDLPLGNPGWKGSSEPLCEPHQGSVEGFSIWADERGVYALFGTSCNSLDIGNPCGKEGVSLQFNDGTGWQWLYEGELAAGLKLTGFEGGPLVLSGVIGEDEGVFLFDEGELTLSRQTDSFPEVFVAGPDLAYAVVDDELLEYRGGTWESLTTLPMTGTAVWAKGETVVVYGENRAYLKTTMTDELEALENVPAGAYFAAWGTSESDLWAGNTVGQLVHYDGNDWSIVETGSTSMITRMWGHADTLYFTTETEFGRHDENGASLLVSNSSALHPQSLWGLSEEEVFLSLYDEAFEEYACGEAFITWFDGSEFHQF